MRWPPHLVQYCRSLCGVLAKVPINSRPCVTFTSSGAHSVKALTGPADQERHDPQWQYPITFGEPVASSFTAPQKHSPLYGPAIFTSIDERHAVDRFCRRRAT